MRTIKFRIWDKSLKRFLPESFDNGIRIAVSLNGKPLALERNVEELGSNFEISQYVGLDDKNGKLIYEGDIMRVKNPEWFAEKYKIGMAVFSGTEFRLSELNRGITNWSPKNRIEIIGNIYKNPELFPED